MHSYLYIVFLNDLHHLRVGVYGTKVTAVGPVDMIVKLFVGLSSEGGML